MSGAADQILASCERFWTAGDVEHPRAGRILADLARTGELHRVRRDLYWRGTPTRFTLADGRTLRSYPDEQQILEQVLDTTAGVGLAGGRAANALGVTTQVSPYFSVTVHQRPPASFRHYRFQDRRQYPARLTAAATGAEITVLEALTVWSHLADYPDAVCRVASTIVEHCDAERLTAAAVTDPPAVRHRLAAVLDTRGITVDNQISSAELDDAHRSLRIAESHG